MIHIQSKWGKAAAIRLVQLFIRLKYGCKVRIKLNEFKLEDTDNDSAKLTLNVEAVMNKDDLDLLLTRIGG